MKKVLLFAMVVTLIIFAAACGSGNSQTSGPSQQSGQSGQTQTQGSGSQQGSQAASSSNEEAKPVEMPKFIKFGTTLSSSGHFAYGVAAGRAIEDGNSGTKVNIIESALADNVPRVNNGEIDIAINNMDVVYEAYHGLGNYQGNPHPNLRNLWNYAVSYHIYAVREDSGVKSLEDLTGKKFMPGGRGTAAELQTQQIFEILGIQPDYYFGSLEDGIDAIKNREAIGLLKIGSANDSTIVNIETSVPLVYLGLTDEQIRKVQEVLAYLKPIKMPAGTFRNQQELTTWAVTNGVMAHKDMPEEVAYNIVKAINEHYDDQAEAFPSLKQINIPELTANNTSIPMHPGAIKYFEEIGVQIPKELYPPEYPGN